MKFAHIKPSFFTLIALLIVTSMVLAACGAPTAEPVAPAENITSATAEAPATEPPQSDIILEENFADNSNNWDIGPKENSESVIEDGKLKVKNQGFSEDEKETIYTHITLPVSAENVDISVDVEFTEGAPENSFSGVICQYKDDDNYIWVGINRAWGYSIQEQVNGEWTTFVRWTPFGLIDQEVGAVNHLRVVCNDGHITLFINDGLAADTVDTASMSGNSSRLFVGSNINDKEDTNPVSVSFSNLVVRKPLAWEAPVGILLSDSFDNNNNAWDLYDKDEYATSTQIQDGQLLLSLEKEDTVVSHSLPVQVSNVDMSFDATIKEGMPSNASIGAVCRRTSSGEYRFLINNGGYWLGEWSKVNEAWEDLIDWTDSSAIKTGIGETNRVRVVCSGSTLELYANDQLLLSIQDESLVSGSTLLRAGRYKEDTATVSVAFDNLEMSYALPAEVLLSDSFDNNDNAWNIYEGSEGSTQIQDGQFVITVKQENMTFWAMPQNNTASDVDVSFDIAIQKGTPVNAAYGVACRYSDMDNYYDFSISSGMYMLGKYVGGTYETLIDWAESTAIKQGAGETNHIRAICSGSNLGLYANGQQLFVLQDTSLTTGGFALEAGKFDVDDAPVSVAFDNLEVK